MPPDSGKLACGYTGKGRLPEPVEILHYINLIVNGVKKDLSGKNILITAGATIEEIDPMRYITNYSTGKMGIALARAAFVRGANVTLIAAEIKENPPHYINVISVKSAQDMYDAVFKINKKMDIIIKAAAVSDYTPQNKSTIKIKKSNDISLSLIRTKDILCELGKQKGKTILVGFAAESENIENYAKEKIKKKNLDFIVANNLSVAGKDDTNVLVIDKNGNKTQLSGSKSDVANQILSIITK